MNQLVPQNAGGATAPAPAKAGPATALAKIEATYIRPIKSEPWTSEQWREVVAITNTGASLGPERARQALAAGPPLAVVEAYIDALGPAIEGPPDVQHTRAMIGILAASYPSGRPADLDAYLDGMLHDVIDMGFSPYVVALACQALRRSVKFLPATSEVVAACIAARDGTPSPSTGRMTGGLEGQRKVAQLLHQRLSAAQKAIDGPSEKST